MFLDREMKNLKKFQDSNNPLTRGLGEYKHSDVKLQNFKIRY